MSDNVRDLTIEQAQALAADWLTWAPECEGPDADALRGWLSRRFIAIAHGHGRLLPGVGWQHIEHAAPGLALDLAAAIEGDLGISETAAAALCGWAWGPS